MRTNKHLKIQSIALSDEECTSSAEDSGEESDTSMEDNFRIHGDDSTDEESNHQAFDDYELATQYQSYKDEQPSYLQSADSSGFSFAAYASGVKLLYSPEVNAYYYPKKKALGHFEVITPSEDNLTSWIKASLITALHASLKCDALPGVSEKFIEMKEELIILTVTKLLDKKRELFKQQHMAGLLPPLNEACEELFKALKNHINKINKFIDVSSSIPFSLHDFSKDKKIQSFVQSEIKEYLDNNNLINQHGNLSCKKDRDKIIQPLLKNKTSSFHKKILTDLSNVRAKSIDSILRENIEEFTLYKIEQSIKKELKNDAPVIIKIEEEDDDDQYRFIEDCDAQLSWLDDANHKFIKKYFPCDLLELQKTLLKQYKGIFNISFPRQLILNQQKYQITLNRPVLSDNHHFKSENSYEFLANLRLSYRDQLRQIRQSIDDSDDDGEKFHRSFQFGVFNKYALEVQEITVNKARRDLVINFKSYEKIFTQWEKLRKAINETLSNNQHPKITDADLACWVMALIQQHSVSLTYKNGMNVPFNSTHIKKLHKLLPNLTYLIFGCEAVRNPATLTTTPLMLERIAQNKLTWKNAISKMESSSKDTFAESKRHIKYGGGEMPMSMSPYKEEAETNNKDKTKKGKKPKKLLSEPVAASRALHEHYGMFAVKAYRYPGDSLNNNNLKDKSKVMELARRENHMVTRWFAEVKKAGKNTSEEEKITLMDDAIKSFYTSKV